MTDETGAPVGDSMALTGPLARRGSWQADGCPAAAALAVVGSRTALLLMREAFYGTTRFDDFVARVQVTEPAAAKRLRELTSAGLLQRVPYQEPGRRTRYEYRLTAKGSDLAPVVLALYDWGAAYLKDAPLTFRHVGCGAPVHVEAVCDEGHRTGLGEIYAEVPEALTG